MKRYCVRKGLTALAEEIAERADIAEEEWTEALGHAEADLRKIRFSAPMNAADASALAAVVALLESNPRFRQMVERQLHGG
jgi:hypothetical protein